MAIADLIPAVSSIEADQADDVDVRADVHDASRLEWVATIPLPARGVSSYTIDVELEIPANVFARHSAWDQLQSWTRLDGPAQVASTGEAVTIDALRRGAIAIAHKLARASDAFARQCRLAGSISAGAPIGDLGETLEMSIEVARAVTREAREQLVTPLATDGSELARERQLVDEYLSVRLLEMLAGAERAIGHLESSRYADVYREAITAAELRIADCLGEEIEHRQGHGYLCADRSSTAALEQYLDRASQLKKHFQEVLFLQPETYQVAQRIRHWVAGLVALCASTWAFAWQLALASNRSGSTGSKVGSGIILLAAVAGAIYATKDRIKEIGKEWMTGKVHRFYAQRVARWRAPSRVRGVRRRSMRDVVVSARESFDQSVVSRPDPLNAASRATVASTVVRYKHKGEVHAQPQLLSGGAKRVKHIFRYDLSPLFARLDDAVKKVPVLDATTRRVSFIDAPRCYRVPVRLRVACGRASREVNSILVLHKRGLDRLE
jgi:hypothetical protein